MSKTEMQCLKHKCDGQNTKLMPKTQMWCLQHKYDAENTNLMPKIQIRWLYIISHQKCI
jgi:hypothetical protein